jgi:hypothetical protein
VPLAVSQGGWDAMDAEDDRLRDVIAAYPARTMADVAAKLRFLSMAQWGEVLSGPADDPDLSYDESVYLALLADVDRLAKASLGVGLIDISSWGRAATATPFRFGAWPLENLQMISDPDIFRAARPLTDQHGEDAERAHRGRPRRSRLNAPTEPAFWLTRFLGGSKR